MTMLNSAKPAALLSLVVLMAGCGGPFYIIPGGELSGSLETKHIDDWSFVEAPFGITVCVLEPSTIRLNKAFGMQSSPRLAQEIEG